MQLVATDGGCQRADWDALVTLVDQLSAEALPVGAVIDAERLRDMLLLAGERGTWSLLPESYVQECIGGSRVCLAGTDGYRGKADATDCSAEAAILQYRKNAVISPVLVATIAHAVIDLVTAAGSAGTGAPLTVAVAEDGRDFFQKTGFVGQLIEAVTGRGCTVHRLGIVPTPVLQMYALARAIPVAFMVTASHNPSDQNGLKVFLNGYKPSLEEDLGEYAITAAVYARALSPAMNAADGSPAGTEDHRSDALSIHLDHVARNLSFPAEAARRLSIVYDGANGAYSLVAAAVFSRLGLTADTVDVTPDGYTINDGCGAAVLEGFRRFSGDVAAEVMAAYPRVVRRVFETGRASVERTVAGIANDGDGDRAYVLVYILAADEVRLLSGDEIAYWIAHDTVSRHGRPVTYANTIESDVMAADAVTRDIGSLYRRLPVGDKWLVQLARENACLTVANELSGHVIFGRSSGSGTSGSGQVFVGDGLVSALSALAAWPEGVSAESFAEPFPPGYSITRPVLLVERSRFFPGSVVWAENIVRIRAMATKFGLAAEQVILEHDRATLLFELKDKDPGTTGVLFVRNSGTEVKLSIGARAHPDLEERINRLVSALYEYNAGAMKGDETFS